MHTKKQITIGRDPTSDICTSSTDTSWQHAIAYALSGEVFVRDEGSSNGTFLNSLENRIESANLKQSDVVYFGSAPVQASEIFRLLVENAAVLESKPANSPNIIQLSLDHRRIILGRSPDADIPLDHPLVSWRHAEFGRVKGKPAVRDLNSTNGTFLNGHPVMKTSLLREGDIVSIGSYQITLGSESQIQTTDSRGHASIDAREISVSVPGKLLLKHVSLAINPGEFVGLMGPSGAGKSTLLNAINGYTRPSSGTVTINGLDLYQCHSAIRCQLGYVPQDDIMHSELTVSEVLKYVGRLRLPRDLSSQEIDARIDRILAQLELTGTQDTLIGSPERKGLSGGQRKRVNLAMELLSDPSILFLDEPTSGLSSEDATTVMMVLRNLADAGKTILVTIHQPSLDAYKLLDAVVVLGKDNNKNSPGRLAYFGNAYPDALTFFNPDHPETKELRPEDLFVGMRACSADEWVRRYATSSHKTNFIDQRQRSIAPKNKSTSVTRKRPFKRPVDSLSQILPLMSRKLRIILRDRANTSLLLAQAPIIALLILAVFGKQANLEESAATQGEILFSQAGALFLLTVSSLWCGCSNAIRTVVGERAIFRRERKVNLSPFAYLTSSFCVHMLVGLVQVALLLGIVICGIPLESRTTTLFTFLIISNAVGVSLGLLLSSLSTSTEFAVATLPLVILPMIVLGGLVQPIADLTSGGRIASTLVASRWSFESLLEAETNADSHAPGSAPALQRQSPALVDIFFDKKRFQHGMTTCNVILLGNTCLFLGLTLMTLSRRNM